MKFLSFSTLICFALATPALADRPVKQKRIDMKERADDSRDRKKIKKLGERFDKARAKNNLKALSRVDAEVMKFLRGEMKESRKEIKRDKREVRSSKRELKATNKRQVKRKLDDKRDLVDDKRDLKVERKEKRKTDALRDEYKALLNKSDSASLDRKRAIIARLIKGERNEVKRDKQELKEDRRETREDRRERNQRRERKRNK